MYTLYGYPKTRSVRVAWALEEANQTYDYKVVDLKRGEHFKEAFKAIHPGAKVPLLATPSGVLAESGAILTYIAQSHAEGTLIPLEATWQRARYNEVMSFLVTELEQPIWNLAKHTFALPPELRWDGMVETAKVEWTRAFGVFTQILGSQPFLLGETFTMVDIMAAQILAWAKNADMPIESPTVLAYMERVLSRPAHEKAWRFERSQLEG